MPGNMLSHARARATRKKNGVHIQCTHAECWCARATIVSHRKSCTLCGAREPDKQVKLRGPFACVCVSERTRARTPAAKLGTHKQAQKRGGRLEKTACHQTPSDFKWHGFRIYVVTFPCGSACAAKLDVYVLRGANLARKCSSILF